MDRLTSLEAFRAVAETGSFTRAAQRLRISTAMMTLHIRRLEEHLGISLFHRTTRRVDLTEDGRRFLGHATGVLEAFAAAEQALRPGNAVAGRVLLDVPASMGHAFIVPALPQLNALYPEITLDLSLGDRGMVFRIDGFDIVLRTGPAPQSGWHSSQLGRTKLICMASPAYLEQHGTPQTAEELYAHRCILYASVEAPGGNPWVITQHGRTSRIRPPAVFTFNDGTAIMAATRAGLGICQNVEMLAREDLRAGRLVRVLPDAEPVWLTVALMSAEDRLALPHVRAVQDFLVERIAWPLDPI